MPTLARPALDPEAAEKFREAGRIASAARDLGASMIQPGVKLREVVESAEAYIRSQGAGMAFPAQTSRNQCAAHYCPSPQDQTVYEAEDVAKIDVGVEVDGYLADTARTVYLGEEKHLRSLVDASAKALEAAIQVAKAGVKVTQISGAIAQAIEANGYRPVPNLTGHGLDRWTVHTAPQIPAVPDRYGDHTLEPGMVIAIEPFATTGKGSVHESGRAEVFMLVKKPRKMKGIDTAAWETIEALQGLPFARRSFAADTPAAVVESTLARLIRTGCLISFPPLVDADPQVRIAQTEHTLLVTESGVEILTQ